MNKIGYFEIQTNDLARARKFYSEIFSWNFIHEQNLPIEYYRIEMAGIYGGLLARPANPPAGGTGNGQGTNAFVCSVEVDDYDEYAKKILEHGGVEALPKFAVLGKCWQGYFLDMEGNTFGIFQPDPSAK